MTRLFTEDHEWISIDGDIATVGISDFALDELGEVVFIDLKAIGTSVTKGEEFGSIESVKTVSGLYSPFNGEITEVNQSLVDSPESISDSPFDDGWMVKIKFSGDDLDELMTEDEYNEFKNRN